jgi:hypothetical protein
MCHSLPSVPRLLSSSILRSFFFASPIPMRRIFRRWSLDSSHVKARMQDVIDREDNDARKLLWKTVLELYEKREVDVLYPIHFAAYAVDPEHHAHHQLTIPQCMAGFSEICEKFFPGDTARQANAIIGLSAFLHGDGVFGRDAAKAAAIMMPVYRWLQIDVCHPASRFSIRAGQTCFSLHLAVPHRAQSQDGGCDEDESAQPPEVRDRRHVDLRLLVCSNARMKDKKCKVEYAEPYMQWLQAPADAEINIAAPCNAMNTFDRTVWIASVEC